MNQNRVIRIGTRGSQLALYQANLTASLLHEKFPGIKIEIVTIKTQGDVTSERGQDPFETKRVFTREIESALLADEVDIAVHSAKDMAVDLPQGLCVGAYLEREDVRDCLLTKNNLTLNNLPQGAKIGTSALRRKMQLLHHAPHLNIETIRGNVDTRIKKMLDGEYDAIVLAYAGLKRLGFLEHISEIFDPAVFFPAPGQGAIMVQLRDNDDDLKEKLSQINHVETEVRLRAERAFLKKLEGGCQLPCGIWTEIDNDEIKMFGVLFGLTEPVQNVCADGSGFVKQPEESGIALAEKILTSGGQKILNEIRGAFGDNHGES